jgi:hypothetical protein
VRSPAGEAPPQARRGRIGGCCCAPGNTLGPRGLTRLMDVLERDDPSDQIGAAWGIKELLRQLLMATGRPATPATSPRSAGPGS